MRGVFAGALAAAAVCGALAHLPEILHDHAHCEKKAASTAIGLVFRYPDHPGLALPLAALAREELEHFDRELDASSLVGRAFMVVLGDGSRVRADAAVFGPASEADENRTVTLWGEFGAPEGPAPTDVVVIDRIWDEAGGPLLGAG